MRIKEITVSLGQTVNLGNFESTRLDVSLTAEVEADTDPTLASAELRERCRRELESLAKQEGINLNRF